ncbi:MAG: glucosaminidase domain-containing protein, partial [Enterococcus thailandicus]|nr:glucosaminidase domain-containing protein [Enterococcus thailandicus]
MKKTNFLLSVMVLGGIVSTAAPVSFADEVGTGNEAIAQSTVSTYENQIAGTETQESALETQNSSTISTTEATAVESSEITEATGSAVEETAPESEEQSTEATEATEATKATETVENQLDDGEVLVHTTQTDLSQFEVSIASRFARSSSNTQQQFIDSVAPSARTLASQNDLYASVMIAQAIVESGWGKSQLASAPNYNLFGIKGSYNGQSVTFPTAEFVN